MSQELHNYLLDYDLRHCLSFNENLKQEGLEKANKEEDPCLGFHDPQTKTLCAFCKPGMARILASYTDADKKIHKAIVCGSVRTPARDADGNYEYLNPSNYKQDDLHK